MRSYNTFCLSVLSFLAQLEHVPEFIYKLEEEALKQAAPGPGNWCNASDLWWLKENFQLPCSCLKLETQA